MLDSNKKIMKENSEAFATVEFNNSTRVGISTACNTGGAITRYAEKDSMIVTDAMATALYCDSDKMYWEGIFYKYFSLVKNYELNKNELKLYFNNKKEYLFFVGH